MNEFLDVAVFLRRIFVWWRFLSPVPCCIERHWTGAPLSLYVNVLTIRFFRFSLSKKREIVNNWQKFHRPIANVLQALAAHFGTVRSPGLVQTQGMAGRTLPPGFAATQACASEWMTGTRAVQTMAALVLTAKSVPAGLAALQRSDLTKSVRNVCRQ